MSTARMNRAECSQRRYLARYRIREALERRDMSMAELARRIGLSAVAVQATVKGMNHSRRILDALREAGVPEKYLFDPNATSDTLAKSA